MKANQNFRRSFLTPFIASSLLGLLCSCATTQHVQSSSRKGALNRTPAQAQRFAMQRELKKQQAIIDELKEKNSVLERKLQITAKPAIPETPIPFQPSAATSLLDRPRLDQEMQSVVANVKGLPQIAPIKKDVGVDADLSGDKLLYSKVLETYRRRDMAEMKKSVDILIKAYPDSIHADNALYLAGLLAVEKEDRPRALSFLERALNEFPNGNKAVASLFLKAIVEKQLGEFAKAKRDLTLVAKLYPGSPEAKRVSLELRLFDLQKRTAKQNQSNPIGEM